MNKRRAARKAFQKLLMSAIISPANPRRPGAQLSKLNRADRRALGYLQETDIQDRL